MKQVKECLSSEGGPGRAGAIELFGSRLDADELAAWLLANLAERLGIDAQAIDPFESLAGYGLDSAEAVGLVADLEDLLGISLQPTLALDYPTVDAIVCFLTLDAAEEQSTALEDTQSDAALLSEVMGLSELSARRLLEEELDALPRHWLTSDERL